MAILCVLVSAILITSILLEAFETLVLPRRIERRFRMTRVFYRTLWGFWTRAGRLFSPEARDNFLSVFGPLSLLLLLAFWATGLVISFALLCWGLRLPIHPVGVHAFGRYLYLSATTFVTLGYGDVYPSSPLARALCDLEAGLGFGFLAIVVGYLPVLYGAFSHREVEIALLDARASSPPSAGEMLRRTAVCLDMGDLHEMLRGYERWAAELLESHLSYQILMFYRSQHDRQSWLSALTTILDTSAFVIATLPDQKINYQARMTFAMARHASIDLALTFNTPPAPPDPDRLPHEDYLRLLQILREAGVTLHEAADSGAEQRLTQLRLLYEPYVDALSRVLQLALPRWLPADVPLDNWQTSAWDRNDHFFQMGDDARPNSRAEDRDAL
jgi:hypothetical protein